MAAPRLTEDELAVKAEAVRAEIADLNAELRQLPYGSFERLPLLRHKHVLSSKLYYFANLERVRVGQVRRRQSKEADMPTIAHREESEHEEQRRGLPTTTEVLARVAPRTWRPEQQTCDRCGHRLSRGQDGERDCLHCGRVLYPPPSLSVEQAVRRWEGKAG